MLDNIGYKNRILTDKSGYLRIIYKDILFYPTLSYFILSYFILFYPILSRYNYYNILSYPKKFWQLGIF